MRGPVLVPGRFRQTGWFPCWTRLRRNGDYESAWRFSVFDRAKGTWPCGAVDWLLVDLYVQVTR